MRGLLAGTLGMLLAATAPQAAEAKLTVVACFPEWAELAREIGGPAVEVFAASAPGSNPDQISVTPELLASKRGPAVFSHPLAGSARRSTSWLAAKGARTAWL